MLVVALYRKGVGFGEIDQPTAGVQSGVETIGRCLVMRILVERHILRNEALELLGPHPGDTCWITSPEAPEVGLDAPHQLRSSCRGRSVWICSELSPGEEISRAPCDAEYRQRSN